MTTARYIRIILILFALLLGVSGEAWAQLSTSDIILDGPFAHGTVSMTAVDAGTRTVTLAIAPASGYYVNKSDIVVQKLVDPSAPNARRRVPDIANALTVSGNVTTTYPATGTYTFIVPVDYAGALVSVTFTGMNPATATVTPNSLTYTGEAQPLVTLGTVVGGAATDPVTYSLSSSGTYTTSIPTATEAGTYTVYYKVAGDATHSEGSGSVSVTIQKATITEVILDKTVQTTGGSRTFTITAVKAGGLTVPSSGYDVSGDALTQSAKGTYTVTVTGKGNFTGSASATFRIMSGVVVIDSGTSADDIKDMNGVYILASDISASKLTNLATGTFTGTMDGDFHKITDLSSALFNTISGGTVKNVILENVSVSGSGNVGAIANEATGDTRIYNCGILSGSVGGSNYVGGLVGLLDGTAHVINCFSYATITSGSNVGGIVGYNNATTTAASINTMVMNCMFYGDITGGSTVSPVYGGLNINNLNSGGLNTFNYYAFDELKSRTISSGKYNCALAVEERYLKRIELYRLLLNSNKKLAAYYASTSTTTVDPDDMAKWILETADKGISNPKPYPVLRKREENKKYPSIINYDVDNASILALVDDKPLEADRNKGGKLGKTLTVTISGVGSNAPEGATIVKGSLTLERTDKDFDRFNFNYDKVQLPYYNDVGTKNYTKNKVVTGWKITRMDGGTPGTYTAADEYGGYNFADRNCTNKDLYGTGGSNRVFSQGAYFDVPYGVSSITIEPYWGNAAYVADEYLDVVCKYQKTTRDGSNNRNDYVPENVTGLGNTFPTGEITIDGSPQTVHTSISSALSTLSGSTVYDNAVVLVGNLHQIGAPSMGDNAFTMMSVDLDKDNEPDYSLIYCDNDRRKVSPLRFDFLNIPGMAQAQKPNGTDILINAAIFKTQGWFEVTNTALIYFTQYEYENRDGGITKADAPLILLGGYIDQFVSTQGLNANLNGNTIYIHVGSNVLINSFGLGTHSDGAKATPHVPVSVTGGDFKEFYLTGTYNQNALVSDDNAECYISGGRFGELAGAAQEQIGSTGSANKGNVRWQIYDADITDFYGGGVNDARPVQGNITTEIFNSHVTTFCGGPKFGNMASGKTVTTTAEGCTFGKYFGAGFGGNSYSRKKYFDNTGPNWNSLDDNYINDRGKYYDGETTRADLDGKHPDYGKKGPGVATDFDYEFFVWTSGAVGGRFFVKFASFSLAQCNNVNSTLKDCLVTGNFYGGGSLGKVSGTATSVLEDCTVNGNVFGAGFSATLPKINVRDGGFTTLPKFNSNSGMFEPGVPAMPTADDESATTEFEWEKVASYPSNGTTGLDGTNVVTTVDISNTNLGSVGSAVLTLKGNTHVIGDVFGGGDASTVNGTSPLGNATVTLQGNTRVGGNVYGGGNHGMVSGSTKVEIKE